MYTTSIFNLPKSFFALIILSFLFIFSSCAKRENITQVTPKTSKSEYQKITAQKAKELIDNESDYTILDVRTKEEYDSEHIPNALLIPDTEIASLAEKKLPNKQQLILVYCRSGRRSKLASKELISLGYTNVLDFGGIIDWPYETVVKDPS